MHDTVPKVDVVVWIGRRWCDRRTIVLQSGQGLVWHDPPIVVSCISNALNCGVGFESASLLPTGKGETNLHQRAPSASHIYAGEIAVRADIPALCSQSG